MSEVNGNDKSATSTNEGLEEPVIHSLKDLQARLNKMFESDSVNVELVKGLMKAYKNNPKDWERYAKFDEHKLTRNLVDAGNGKFNLMLVCWRGGHTSTLHDHASSHCFMRVLQGTLTEVRFDWPKEGEEQTGSLRELSRFPLHSNEVSYINDSIGLHRMENSSQTDLAVSLHLYCPPFSECSVFDEKTGSRMKCQVTFWSKYGERTVC